MDKVCSEFNQKLLRSGAYTEMLLGYWKLKTDQERIIFALNLMQEYDIVPSAIGMPKNAEESEKWRERGNKIYIKGGHNNKTCIEVLKLYTKSIAFAPYPSVQLSLGYVNRSAVLFHLGLYFECIQDIDRALALNYPKDKKQKLYARKKECRKKTLEEPQPCMDKMPPDDTKREELRAEYEVLHNEMVQMKLYNMTNTMEKTGEPPALPTIEFYNNEVPCASNAIALKYNEQYGRHLVATRNIRPGEVIAVEKPYSLMLLKENVQTHCSNCLSACWATIPCNYCTYAMYCSEDCRNIEWRKRHDIECTVFPTLIENGMNDNDLFSVRLAILALREAGDIKELKTMLNEVDNCNDPRIKGFSSDGKLHSDRYVGLYSLVTNTEKRSFSELFWRSVDASFILYFLATRTVLFGAKLVPNLIALAINNDVTFFGGLILRHHQIIPGNVHAV